MILIWNQPFYRLDCPLFLHRMGVVLMNNNNRFDFKDLMAFGMFILALITFIFVNLKYCFKA